jgi:hypothetical protein
MPLYHGPRHGTSGSLSWHTEAASWHIGVTWHCWHTTVILAHSVADSVLTPNSCHAAQPGGGSRLFKSAIHWDSETKQSTLVAASIQEIFHSTYLQKAWVVHALTSLWINNVEAWLCCFTPSSSHESSGFLNFLLLFLDGFIINNNLIDRTGL